MPFFVIETLMSQASCNIIIFFMYYSKIKYNLFNSATHKVI